MGQERWWVTQFNYGWADIIMAPGYIEYMLAGGVTSQSTYQFTNESIKEKT